MHLAQRPPLKPAFFQPARCDHQVERAVFEKEILEISFRSSIVRRQHGHVVESALKQLLDARVVRSGEIEDTRLRAQFEMLELITHG